MSVQIHSAVARRTIPEPHRDRTATPLRLEATPHSAYLYRWLIRQAARYDDLLKTIEADPRRTRARVDSQPES